MPTDFVVPGANRMSAALDLARTIVRRAERLVVSFPVEGSEWAGTSIDCRTFCGPWPVPPKAKTTPWPVAPAPGGGRRTVMNVETGDAVSLGPDLSVIGVPVAEGEGGPQVVAPVGTVPGLASVPVPLMRRGASVTGSTARSVKPCTSAPLRLVALMAPTSCWWGWATPPHLDGDAGLEWLRRAAAAFVRVAGNGDRRLPDSRQPAGRRARGGRRGRRRPAGLLPL